MIILHKKMHKMHLNVLKNIKHSSNLDRLEKDILFFLHENVLRIT